MGTGVRVVSLLWGVALGVLHLAEACGVQRGGGKAKKITKL